jgi:hypothetical protein
LRLETINGRNFRDTQGTSYLFSSTAVPRSYTLEENIAAADLDLTEDELREIENALPEAQGARYSEAHQRMIDR